MFCHARYVQKLCQNNVTHGTVRLTWGKSILHWMFAVPLQLCKFDMDIAASFQFCHMWQSWRFGVQTLSLSLSPPPSIHVPMLGRREPLVCKLRLLIFPTKNYLYIPPQIALDMEIWMTWISNHLNEHVQKNVRNSRVASLLAIIDWIAVAWSFCALSMALWPHQNLGDGKTSTRRFPINGHPSQKRTKRVDVTDWWLHVFFATSNMVRWKNKQSFWNFTISQTLKVTPTNEPEVHTEHTCEDV